ncbi:MAG: hypothetical protein AB8B53_11690 [Flavobacteriales bacterium]
MKVLIVAISLISSFTLTSSAVSNINSNVVIEIQALTPELFKEYMLKSLENSNIEILEACVPANVIYIMYSGNLNDSGLLEIKDFFNPPSSNIQVNLLLNDDLEDFTNKCLAARLGN